MWCSLKYPVFVRVVLWALVLRRVRVCTHCAREQGAKTLSVCLVRADSSLPSVHVITLYTATKELLPRREMLLWYRFYVVFASHISRCSALFLYCASRQSGVLGFASVERSKKRRLTCGRMCFSNLMSGNATFVNLLNCSMDVQTRPRALFT